MSKLLGRLACVGAALALSLWTAGPAWADPPRPTDGLQAPVVVTVDPHTVQSGGVMTIAILDLDGADLTQATFTFYGQDGQALATFSAPLTAAPSEDRGPNIGWVANAIAPTVQSDTHGYLQATVTTSTGQVSPQSIDRVELEIDGQPLNQLPEAPYAAIFPAILLVAFGVTRRRRNAA